jgi:hypothetical protein
MPHRLLLLSLATALATACVVDNTPPKDPCDPNPCTQANRTQCVNEAGQARCICDAGFVTRPSGACEPLGPQNCPEHEGDAAEPDDCQARARTLTFDGQARMQTLQPVGDYDFFTFNATSKHLYTITVQPEGSPLLPRIDAFDQGGVWLATAEAPQKAEFTLHTRFTAPYFVRVSHSPLDPSSAVGPYSLRISDRGEDDHGDLPDDATHISPDSPASPTTRYGRLEYNRDEDWFSFSALNGEIYRVTFDTSRLVPAVAAYVGNDTRQPFLLTRNASFDIHAASNATVYLVAYSPEGSQGSYAFSLVRIQ